MLSSGQHPANAPSTKAYFRAVQALASTPSGPTPFSARSARGTAGRPGSAKPAAAPVRPAETRLRTGSSGWAEPPTPPDGSTSKTREMPADSGRFTACLPPCPVGRVSLALWLSRSLSAKCYLRHMFHTFIPFRSIILGANC